MTFYDLETLMKYKKQSISTWKVRSQDGSVTVWPFIVPKDEAHFYDTCFFNPLLL